MSHPEICTAFFIRHGATANNLSNPPILQGRGIDLGLSEEGCLQAQQTAELLSTEPIVAVYSSPLLRASETAAAIAQRHHLNVQTIDALTEADVGDWEGQTWNTIERDQPEAYAQFMQDSGKHGYSGGENLTQVQERVLPAVREIMKSHFGETIAVVAHNVVNRVLLATIVGLPVRKASKMTQHNGGVSELRLRGEKFSVRTMNATFHLR